MATKQSIIGRVLNIILPFIGYSIRVEDY
jgi:hypothetical protein